ncbi:hypothetical protein, partial [Pseudomonas syringae]|uniref:hypothetical protein n=1 Tax=Pseudomonas syringae TaxID=317 RepID=UPI001F385B71
PNSAVKRCIADGSVGFPHVRVGHRQDSIPKPLIAHAVRGFVFFSFKNKRSFLCTMPRRGYHACLIARRSLNADVVEANF